jgi:predicted RNase H-like HicB family nuclease
MDYHINVFYSAEDECYVADTPNLQYCSAFGDSPEEALAEVREAMAIWIDSAREEGKPDGTSSPVPSGYLPVRLIDGRLVCPKGIGQ